MSKTRKQRQRYDSERRALAGIAALVVLFVVFCAAGTRAFALCSL